jgi:pyruvate/2-oxoglutarate dehydrogenase complex dihydrolipoamide acyltransferase (E2) component|tara:strand:+ start:174 stop:1253 length:1080 start_codon:yes stop_codon:yes gene_type:complete
MKKIIAEQYNVNDESYKLIQILVKDKQSIKKDQPIFNIETSKASVEISSPYKGIIKILKKINDNIKVGDELAYMFENIVDLEKFQKKYKNIRNSQTNIKSDISAKALKLIQTRKLDIEEIKKLNLRTEKEIIEYEKNRKKNLKIGVSANIIEKFTSEILPKSKKLEIENLYKSKNMLPCICGIEITNFDILSFSKKNNLFFNNFSPILIHIISKIIGRYKNLNGFFENNNRNYYKKLNVSFTYNYNNVLYSPVIYDCKKNSLEDIKLKMINLTKKIISNEIRTTDLSKGTFTVSDLSLVNDLSYQVPIIPAYTSCILGISLHKINKSLNCCLVYDHQMSSGKEASMFLYKVVEEFNKYR